MGNYGDYLEQQYEAEENALKNAKRVGELEPRVETLEGLLRDCREQLHLYRARHTGAYACCAEYAKLLRRIDEALN